MANRLDSTSAAAAQYENLRAFLDHRVTRDDRSDGSDADWIQQTAWEHTQMTYPQAVADTNTAVWEIANPRFPDGPLYNANGEKERDPNGVWGMTRETRQAHFSAAYGDERLDELRASCEQLVNDTLQADGPTAAFAVLQDPTFAATDYSERYRELQAQTDAAMAAAERPPLTEEERQ